MQHKIQLFTNILFWLGTLTGLIYCAVCILLYFQQTRFIFFPSSKVETTPRFLNLHYEEVWIPIQIQSHQVEYIHSWWLRPNQSNGKVVLYLHGNGINIGANIANASRFYQLGFSVLLIDYRGYGNSRGRFPNERRVCEDAAIAWNYLVHQRKIAPSQIFIYGHSLGGAIAIDLAIKQPEAAGLIVESSFTSIRQVVAYRNIFRMFPVGLILTQRFESIQKVPQLKMPILFIHGISDITIPAFMSEELYAAAPEPKRLLLVSDGGHNNIAEVAAAEYLQAVLWLSNQLNQTNKN